MLNLSKHIKTIMVGQALHSASRLATILLSKWGWLIGGGIAVSEFLAGHAYILFLVVAVTSIDAFWGIIVSWKQGRFTLSELARLTVAKCAVYGVALGVFIGLDKLVDTTITAGVVGALIVLIELWSTFARKLILFPDLLFLRLLRYALIGEIASKLHIDEEEVKKLMGIENKDKPKTE